MQNKIILMLLLFATLLSYAQGESPGETGKQKVTLSGTISDLKTNETLIGVNLYIPEIKAGIVTNEYGFYSITIPKGDYTLQISYLGYETITEAILLTRDVKKNIGLSEAGQDQKMAIIPFNQKHHPKSIRRKVQGHF